MRQSRPSRAVHTHQKEPERSAVTVGYHALPLFAEAERGADQPYFEPKRYLTTQPRALFSAHAAHMLLSFAASDG